VTEKCQIRLYKFEKSWFFHKVYSVSLSQQSFSALLGTHHHLIRPSFPTVFLFSF
jgi:hypothetical protein